MTDYALKTLKFILYKNFSVYFYRLMAGLAGNFCMPAFQLKSRIIMIKIVDRPIVKSMTAGTIRDSILLELLIMDILVASGTLS